MNYFYMDEQNREIGPVSLENLKSFRAADVIKDHTLVRPESGGPWAACVTVVGTIMASSNVRTQQSAAMAKVSEAVQHAKTVWVMLLTNPVGGLAPAYQQLGPKRAGEAGAVFLGASTILFVLLVYMTKTFAMLRPNDFGGFVKLLFTTFACYAAWAAALAIVRLINRRDGSIAGEVFVAGTMSLIWSIVLLLIGILGFGNVEFMLILFLVSICVMVLQIFVGLTRISGLDERIGTIMVPLVLVAGVWFAKIIFSAVYSSQLAEGLSDSFKGLLR